MRYLLISIALLALSCGSYPKKQNLAASSTQKALTIPYFANPDIDYIYKANIDFLDKHFGGLLIIKKTDLKSHRIVFTTEMGNKIFDFSFINNDFQVNFIPEELNRKIVLKILEQDFRVLICKEPKIVKSYVLVGNPVLEGIINGKVHYFFINKNGYVEKTVFPKHGKANVDYTFSKINSDIAQEIEIVHHSINMNITLKSFNSL